MSGVEADGLVDAVDPGAAEGGALTSGGLGWGADGLPSCWSRG